MADLAWSGPFLLFVFFLRTLDVRKWHLRAKAQANVSTNIKLISIVSVSDPFEISFIFDNYGLPKNLMFLVRRYGFKGRLEGTGAARRRGEVAPGSPTPSGEQRSSCGHSLRKTASARFKFGGADTKRSSNRAQTEFKPLRPAGKVVWEAA